MKIDDEIHITKQHLGLRSAKAQLRSANMKAQNVFQGWCFTEQSLGSDETQQSRTVILTRNWQEGQRKFVYLI